MTASPDFFKNICKINRAFGSTLEHKALLEFGFNKALLVSTNYFAVRALHSNFANIS